MVTPRLTVEPAQLLGNIKPVNGVNNGPYCMDGIVNLHNQFVAARFGDIRTHDPNFRCRDVCDISAVFPNEEADPEDPANYDFERTDHYLKTIREASNCPITYRLGYTIDHHALRRYCHPPKNFEHWAKICVGIAKHYNEGWAKGHHDWVKRWEIWNEPDNDTGPDSPCWTGTLDEFLRLYEVTSKALKAHNPNWLVGGPSAGGVFSTPILKKMLEFCPRTNSPLDFYSWHSYETRPDELMRLARHLRSSLDNVGLNKTQIILNEWHSGPNLEWGPLYRGTDPERRRIKAEEMNGRPAAAYTAAAMLAMQDGPVDIANYYSGDTMLYFGMFDIYGEPLMPYQAFLSFAHLLDTPQQVAINRADVPASVYAVAGRNDKGDIHLMAVNYDSKPVSIELAVKDTTAIWKLLHGFGWASQDDQTLTLPGHAFGCVNATATC